MLPRLAGPVVRWRTLAVLYLVAAVLLGWLAVASSAWWTWLLASASVAAAAACGLVGRSRRAVQR
jgi:hypothetical protein